MNALMLILLTIASWGQGIKKFMGFSENSDNTAVLSGKGTRVDDKYPWMADIRAKTKSLSESDRNTAISFLARNLDRAVLKKLEAFEACQAFDSIVISDSQAETLIQTMAQQVSSYATQRAILLIVLAVGATVRSLDMRKCIQQVESEGMIIVPYKGSWAVKMKSGAIWPADVVKKFM